MLSQLIALAVSIVLSWASFTAQGQVVSFASSHAEQVDGSQQVPVQDGSVDDHLLNDLPAQAQAEGAMDMPALVMARPEARMPLLTMARPRPHASSAWLSPFLDGPQRPPCAEPLSA